MRCFIVVLAAAVIALFVAAVKLYWEKKKYRETLNAVLEHLDLAISGTQQEAAYDESMEAAITERLNRLVEISRGNVKNAEQDRHMVQTLISDIAHQVRTPLTNIMLYSGILQERMQSPDNQKLASQIFRQSEKLDFFMKELVKSSYLETDLITVHPQQGDIDELVAEVCQEMEVSALRKKIIFRISECGKTGKFDKKWTKEALVNLLDNAIKYSPEGSLISVDSLFYENFFCIRISDQGMGIAEQEQGAIFKRFYRSEAAKEERGIGIGLYLVREIIEKQNGYVKVNSTPGKGSTFSVYLPGE